MSIAPFFSRTVFQPPGPVGTAPRPISSSQTTFPVTVQDFQASKSSPENEQVSMQARFHAFQGRSHPSTFGANVPLVIHRGDKRNRSSKMVRALVPDQLVPIFLNHYEIGKNAYENFMKETGGDYEGCSIKELMVDPIRSPTGKRRRVEHREDAVMTIFDRDGQNANEVRDLFLIPEQVRDSFYLYGIANNWQTMGIDLSVNAYVDGWSMINCYWPLSKLTKGAAVGFIIKNNDIGQLDVVPWCSGDRNCKSPSMLEMMGVDIAGCATQGFFWRIGTFEHADALTSTDMYPRFKVAETEEEFRRLHSTQTAKARFSLNFGITG